MFKKYNVIDELGNVQGCYYGYNNSGTSEEDERKSNFLKASSIEELECLKGVSKMCFIFETDYKVSSNV